MDFLSIIYLPYIHWAYGLCYTNLAYPKEYVFILRSTYIIYIIYNIIIQESSMMFCMMYDCVTVCDSNI